MSQLFRLPTFTAIVIAVILLAVGRLISSYDVFASLGAITEYLRGSLQSFDAFNIASTFYRKLTGCELHWTDQGFEVVCQPGLDTLDYPQGQREPGLIGRLLMAVVNTIGSLWNGSTWLGIFVYAVALLIGAASLAHAMEPRDEPFLWLSLIVLVPLVASLVALALKWLLLLCVLVFSEALAWLAWLLATFGFVIAWVRSVLETAHQVDDMVLGTGAAATDATHKDVSKRK